MGPEEDAVRRGSKGGTEEVYLKYNGRSERPEGYLQEETTKVEQTNDCNHGSSAMLARMWELMECCAHSTCPKPVEPSALMPPDPTSTTE